MAARSRANLERRRPQIEQWIAEGTVADPSGRTDSAASHIEAQLARIDQAAQLPDLEEAFVKVAAAWAKRSGVSAAALREVGVPARVLAEAGL